MDKQEQQAIEQLIDQFGGTIIELTLQKNELEERISELRGKQQALIRMLPPEKRIERLFH